MISASSDVSSSLDRDRSGVVVPIGGNGSGQVGGGEVGSVEEAFLLLEAGEEKEVLLTDDIDPRRSRLANRMFSLLLRGMKECELLLLGEVGGVAYRAEMGVPCEENRCAIGVGEGVFVWRCSSCSVAYCDAIDCRPGKGICVCDECEEASDCRTGELVIDACRELDGEG